MREYEIVWIVAPTETDEAVEGLVGQYRELLETRGTKFINVENWGRRKLAYDINRHREGSYVLFQVESEPEPLRELERQFGLSDIIIRHMTIRMDEDMRRARKRAAERAARKGTPEGGEAEAVAGGEDDETSEAEPRAERQAAEPAERPTEAEAEEADESGESGESDRGGEA